MTHPVCLHCLAPLTDFRGPLEWRDAGGDSYWRVPGGCVPDEADCDNCGNLSEDEWTLSDENDAEARLREIESGLRSRFLEEVAPAVIAHYGADDTIALDEEWSNWTDALCKDGEISTFIYERVTRTDD